MAPPEIETPEILCGAPNPPGVLIAMRALHPRTLPEEIEEVIRGILLTGDAPLSMFEVYRALVARGVMEFDPDAARFREHPTIQDIAGACQYLYFSGQLAALEGAPSCS